MNSRDQEDLIFLKIAFEYANFSHCISRKVGCVIVKDRRILSTGCNGTPSGHINCDDFFRRKKLDLSDPKDRKIHSEWSVENEVHSELNALLYCAKYGISVDGAALYVTMTPCKQCLKNIIQTGIKKVIYAYEYDKPTYDITSDKLIKNTKTIISKPSKEVIDKLRILIINNKNNL